MRNVDSLSSKVSFIHSDTKMTLSSVVAALGRLRRSQVEVSLGLDQSLVLLMGLVASGGFIRKDLQAQG